MQFVGSPQAQQKLVMKSSKRGGSVASRSTSTTSQRFKGQTTSPINNQDNSNNSTASGGAYSTASKTRGLYRAPQPTLRESTATSKHRFGTFGGDQQRKVIYGVELLKSRNETSTDLLLDRAGNTRRRRRDNTNSSVTGNSASIASSRGGGSYRQQHRNSGSYCAMERQSSENSLEVDGLVSLHSDTENKDYNSDDDEEDEDDEEDDDEDHNYRRRRRHPDILRINSCQSARGRDFQQTDSSSRSSLFVRDNNSVTVEDISASSSRLTSPRRTPNSSKAVMLQQRNSSRNFTKVFNQQQQNQYNTNSGSSSKLMTQFNGNGHESFSDHHFHNSNSYTSYSNAAHDIGYGDEMVALNYQSDILFVESGADNSHCNVKQPLYKRWLKTMKNMQAPHHKSKSYSNSSSLYHCCKLLPLRFSGYINNLRSTNYGIHPTIPIKRQYSGWVWQIVLFMICAAVIFDSRRTIRQNRMLIQHYDEERAHILEQMTWIDRAAKRVRNTYQTSISASNAALANAAILGSSTGEVNVANEMNSSSINSNASKSSIDRSLLFQNIQSERDEAKRQLDRLQIRIQSNSRDRNLLQFGDKPMQISIPLDSVQLEIPDTTTLHGGEHLIIALSDDTPHAVSTLLQQISRKIWDDIEIQRLETSINPIPGRLSSHDHKLDSIQISPKLSNYANVSPSLEFVEKSRRCYHEGSVSLRQLESDDFHFIVLKVHVTEQSPSTHKDDDEDVCIGTVVSGLDTLKRLLPDLAIVHKEFDDIEDADHDLPIEGVDPKKETSKEVNGEGEVGSDKELVTTGPVVRETG